MLKQQNYKMLLKSKLMTQKKKRKKYLLKINVYPIKNKILQAVVQRNLNKRLCALYFLTVFILCRDICKS